jgi:hypothetical protein
MASTFETLFAGTISTDQTLVVGTCSFGDTFGQVLSANIKRGGDTKEILNCKGGLRAFLIRNVKTVLNMKTIFSTADDIPNLGDVIALPLIAVGGIVHDVTVEWEHDGERMLSIDATGWDSLGDAPTTHHWSGSAWAAVWD